MGGAETCKRYKALAAALAITHIRSYWRSTELDPKKIELVKKEMAKVVGDSEASEILELAERIFWETWKRSAEDPDITFFDTAAELAGE